VSRRERSIESIRDVKKVKVDVIAEDLKEPLHGVQCVHTRFGLGGDCDLDGDLEGRKEGGEERRGEERRGEERRKGGRVEEWENTLAMLDLGQSCKLMFSYVLS